MASYPEFSVQRGKPELISPAEPTPYELKPLSDIDDQQALRFQAPLIFFYPHNPSIPMKRDPRLTIREALAKALVYYYPLAGRLREEGSNGKLTVECTGEGILYIRADSDIRLGQFGGRNIHPPFPLDQLLFDVPDSSGILNCPILLIQVTRLLCGGFILAVRLNHTVLDGQGLVQFLNAVAEIARGAKTPSIVPVWERDQFFKARDPPRVTYVHHEYHDQREDCLTKGSHDDDNDISLDGFVKKSLYFGPSEISALRSHLPPHLKHSCSSFEMITACLWRCRTIALDLAPTETTRLIFAVSGRGKPQCPLPAGYYGNTIAIPGVVATAEKLCKNPLGYALELIKKTKSSTVNNIGDYLQSVVNFMALNNRPPFRLTQTTFIVSDNSRIGWTEVDFGWGKPVYAGPADTNLMTLYSRSRNKEAEVGIVAPIKLPKLRMERFVQEVRRISTPTMPNSKFLSLLQMGRRLIK